MDLQRMRNPCADGTATSMKNHVLLRAAILVGFSQLAHGASTALWMREESRSATPHTAERQAGTNSTTLPFYGTTNYDFFSPPLTSSISFTTADKGGGVIYMRNSGPVGAFDFSVKGQMRYFDYDPATKTETLIVDTGASPQKNVNHGQTVNWALPNVSLHAAKTLSPGHLLHVSVTVTLTAGFPWMFGSFVYNGPAGTQAQLPQQRAISYPFGPLPPIAPPWLACSSSPDGSKNLSCSGSPGEIYTIEATSNLNHPVWQPLITTNANASGLLWFIDRDATNFPCRFYRTAQ